MRIEQIYTENITKVVIPKNGSKIAQVTFVPPLRGLLGDIRIYIDIKSKSVIGRGANA